MLAGHSLYLLLCLVVVGQAGAVGLMVAKHFGARGLFAGVIQSVDRAKDTNLALFSVLYNDGETEDFYLEEMKL